VTDSPVQIKFGTDGWRAIIAREFTFVNVERVAQAYADFLARQAADGSKPLVVIGFDRRFLSEKFAARTAEVMAGNGFQNALFSEAQPTPLISWAVKNLGAVGGVMITASHNPANFNGFKIKAPWGGSAAPETTHEVEQLVVATAPK
jgi:phosphomannomutase